MKSRWIATAFCLSLVALAGDRAVAGKGNPHLSAKQLTVAPQVVTSPISPTGAMNICVLGFNEGDYVKVSIPWIGSPTSHTNLVYEHLADPSGGFCFACPPDWTEIDLQAGSYTIVTQWGKSGTGGLRRGPTATFSVTGD